jgi:hypothetical protein
MDIKILQNVGKRTEKQVVMGTTGEWDGTFFIIIIFPDFFIFPSSFISID